MKVRVKLKTKKDLNMINLYKKNIRRVYKSVKLEDIDSGMGWYWEARKFCTQISKEYNVPLYKVVGILSALSPRNRWERNKIDTISILTKGEGATVATFNPNKRKALKILKAEEGEVLSILNGMKTKSFYSNIYNAIDEEVTIDVWAVRVAGLEGSLTSKRYADIAEAFRVVALELGVMPKQLQALTWGAVRLNYN